jgi:hypothetical protein
VPAPEPDNHEAPNQSASARAHSANQRIARAARQHKFGTDVKVPFVCECGSPNCRETLPITLTDYDTTQTQGPTYLTHPDHVADGTLIHQTTVFSTYRPA